ncbi:MAG: xanthine dehydrogenase family protein subunit M [Proteobacteria bacterium]|nr:xanthine dehydrogenase family protein subunit M [Pseudomonadota bacterium]
MGEYRQPHTLEELQTALKAGTAQILAGGTDFYPARVGQPLTQNVIDITRVSGLRGVTEYPDHWRIGATTTWTDIIRESLPPIFDGLKLAAREVGGCQVQNAGTIGGNLCNASPAADGVPVLLSLEAEVEISNGENVQRLKLEEFILGNRRTALQEGSVLTAILIPKPAEEDARSMFLKLGARKYLVISLVMVAMVVEMDASGKISTCRIAVGACSEVAMRLTSLEAELTGHKLTLSLLDNVTEDKVKLLSPLDDVRASREYRLDAAVTLIRRTIERLVTA